MPSPQKVDNIEEPAILGPPNPAGASAALPPGSTAAAAAAAGSSTAAAAGSLAAVESTVAADGMRLAQEVIAQTEELLSPFALFGNVIMEGIGSAIDDIAKP